MLFLEEVSAAAVAETTKQSFFDTIKAFQIGNISISGLLSALLILVVCAIIIKIITTIVGKALDKSKKIDNTLRGFVTSAIKAALWVIALIIVANALGIDTASLVAVVGIIGLALSLSVQNILSNLFSGLTLLITKPFAAGDFVEIAGKTGIVKTVGLFYTQLNSLDNIAVSIPNSDVTAASVNNYSHEELRRVDQYFCAAYTEDTDKVKAAILEAAGDFVEVGGKTGIVKTIGLFYTQLDTLDNIAVSIPNSDVTAAAVNNYSREELRRVDRTFTTSYDCTTDEVKAAIADAIAKDELILQDPAPFVRLIDYKGSTVEYVVRVWCKSADYWTVYFNLNENVRESFAAHGVKFSYEHVNVHIVEK